METCATLPTGACAKKRFQMQLQELTIVMEYNKYIQNQPMSEVLTANGEMRNQQEATS